MIRELKAKLLEAIRSNADERVVLEWALAIINYSAAREESAGAFCIRFGETALALLASTAEDQVVGSDRQDTLRAVCDAAVRRGFPVMLWTRLVRENLNQPGFVVEELTNVMGAKKGLNAKVRRVAAGSTEILGMTSDAKVFVDGYSITAKDAVLGLTDTLGTDFPVYAAEAVGHRGYSEGKLLRDALEKRHVKVTVLTDTEAADFLAETGVALFLTGGKAVSVFGAGHPEAIGSVRRYDYPSLAKSCAEQQTKLVIVTGSYKFWPRDLYEDVRALRVQGQAPQNPRTDTILPSELIDFWMTEDGVFTNEALVDRYRREFQPIPERFPRWALRSSEVAGKVRELLRGWGFDPERLAQAEFDEWVDVYRCQKYVQDHWEKLLSQYEGRYLACVDETEIHDAATLEEIESFVDSTQRKHVYVEKMVPRQRRQIVMSPGASR